MKSILAIVGMPGSGKSEAVAYLRDAKKIPFVRFGDFTDEEVRARGLPHTPENERFVRETLRAEFGMAAYAMKAKGKIDALLAAHDVVAIDGLYSWEEYTYLRKEHPNLTLIHVFAERAVRYERLAHRTVRPVPEQEGLARDIGEIEKLNKGGPIAMADYLIQNSGTREDLHRSLDWLVTRLEIRESYK